MNVTTPFIPNIPKFTTYDPSEFVTSTSTRINVTLNSSHDTWGQLAYYIGLIYPAVYVIIGVPLNIANIVVFRNRWKKSSYFVYVIILSFVDSLVLLHRAAGAYLPKTSITLTSAMCKWIQFGIQVSSQISSWTLVLLCCERAIVVKFPFFRLTLFTYKTAILSTSIVTLLIIPLNFIVLLAVKAYVRQGNLYYCGYSDEYLPLMRTVWYKVEAFVYVFLPMILMLISNIVIICCIDATAGLRDKKDDTQHKSPKLSGSDHSDSTNVTIPTYFKDIFYNRKHSTRNRIARTNQLMVTGINKTADADIIKITKAKAQTASMGFLISMKRKKKREKIKKPNRFLKSEENLRDLEATLHAQSNNTLKPEYLPLLRKYSSAVVRPKQHILKSLLVSSNPHRDQECIQLNKMGSKSEIFQKGGRVVKSTSLVNFEKPTYRPNDFKAYSQSVTNLNSVTGKSLIRSQAFPCLNYLQPDLKMPIHSFKSGYTKPLVLNRDLQVNHNHRFKSNRGSDRDKQCCKNLYYTQISKSIILAFFIYFGTTSLYCAISIFINFIYTPDIHSNTPFTGFIMTFSVAMCDANHVINYFIYSTKPGNVFSLVKTIVLKCFRMDRRPTWKRTSSVLKRSSTRSPRSTGTRPSHEVNL